MAIVFFDPRKENGLLSTWSPHEIVFHDITFLTAEHFIAYEKARLLDLPNVMEQIIKAKTPHVANKIYKDIGRHPSDKRKWERYSQGVVLQALRLKVDQHMDVFHFLRKLPKHIRIGYASKHDKVWGIHMDISDPCVRMPRKWNGMNLLGEAWMQVKSEILEK